MIRLSELAAVSGASAVGTAPDGDCLGFAYDSRADCRDRVFVAIRTETGDGHEHVCEAIRRGARAALCERMPPGVSPRMPLLLVPDVPEAMADWARQAVRCWNPVVVAITGSLGKTTTKELAWRAMSPCFSVSASPGNLSGRLGLPIAIADMSRETAVAVLEFATDSFGEMQAMMGMAPPQVVVVTNVCERHAGVFGGLENVAAEMGLAVSQASGGMAVLNRDDERVWGLRCRASRVISYGLGDADVRASDVRLTDRGLSFVVDCGGEREECQVRLFGPALVYDCLAAIAAAIGLGVPLGEAVAGLAEAEPLPGRLNQIAQGAEGARLLDDTFSACPTSLKVALEALWLLPGSEKHAVLGDLDDWDESGRQTAELAEAVASSAHKLWALGDRAGELASRVRLLGKDVGVFYSHGQLAQALKSSVRPGDVVLIKGNRASRMERVVAALMDETGGEGATSEAQPAPGAVLVRQEPYWETVRLVRPERPTWVEIDVEALARNTRLLREACGVPIMAVLKADGYGHGAARVARVVLENGAEALGVACLSEAKALRRAGVDTDVFILGYTPPWQAREAVREGIVCAVFGEEEGYALSRAAVALGTRARVHVKVDSGMNRLGLQPEEMPAFLSWLARLPALCVEGVFTHFGNADDRDKRWALEQLRCFQSVLETLDEDGLRPRLAHAANTAAALTIPESRLDMVRLGIGLYGLAPSAAVPLPSGTAPVLSFKTTVSQVKEPRLHTYVGYGRSWRVEREMRLAVIPVGYADGFRRGPANWGEVLIRGKRCPVVGNVCMDQAMVDVSDVPGVRKGDEVVLIGRQGEASIGAEEVAQRLGTISYEVVSQILARVPRMT